MLLAVKLVVLLSGGNIAAQFWAQVVREQVIRDADVHRLWASTEIVTPITSALWHNIKVIQTHMCNLTVIEQ